MSAVGPLPVLAIPQFSAEHIDMALVMAQTAPDEFRRAQLLTMSTLNHPLKAFFEAKIGAFGARGESEACDRWMAGYTIGHSALRSAAPDETPLPKRTTDELHSFALFIHRNPLALSNLIAQDYEAHPTIPALLGKVEEFNDGDTAGARFILGAYGRWANPNRPALDLPFVAEPTVPNGLRRSRQKQVFTPLRQRSH